MVTLNCAHYEKRTAGTTTNGEKCATPKRVFEAKKPIPDTLTARNLFGGGMYEYPGSFDEGWLQLAMYTDRQQQRFADQVGKCAKKNNATTNTCAQQ